VNIKILKIVIFQIKLKREEGKMQTETKEIETYENIIQNLSALKEEAIEPKLKEKDTKQLEAYECIIQNLFALKEEAIEPKHQAKRNRSDSGNIAYALRPI